MNEMMKPDELLELTKQDRMRIFQEDLRALDELAQVVHRKALDGDNAAGHLDLKIRERKAQMFGYDSPQQYDMTLVAELRRPTTTDAIKTIIDRMVNEGRVSDDSKQRVRALGGYLPESGKPSRKYVATYVRLGLLISQLSNINTLCLVVLRIPSPWRTPI
jgi:hypothetical protein